MNKTDRLLAIVLKLQSRRRIRAEDLAEIFETSKRTIYRDIQALCEAGVPVVSIPGQGYSLVEGYFLPPVSFTTDEAMMLLLGADYIGHSFDAQYRTASRTAAFKIEGVLPQAILQDVQWLQRNIRLIPHDGGDSATLKELRRAIVESHTVAFLYHTRHVQDGAPASLRREADPYGLVFHDRAWHLAAYCHLRRDVRNFRLDRIEDLSVTERTFTRPADFALERSNSTGERATTVHVLFSHEVARWIRETPSFFTIEMQDLPDGLLATLQVRQESDVAGWLLGWGRHARVLEPESLRRLMAEEARAVLSTYDQP